MTVTRTSSRAQACVTRESVPRASLGSRFVQSASRVDLFRPEAPKAKSSPDSFRPKAPRDRALSLTRATKATDYGDFFHPKVPEACSYRSVFSHRQIKNTVTDQVLSDWTFKCKKYTANTVISRLYSMREI